MEGWEKLIEAATKTTLATMERARQLEEHRRKRQEKDTDLTIEQLRDSIERFDHAAELAEEVEYMPDEWEGRQLCPYIDCAWKCALRGEGWYQCPHCGRPFYASDCDSDYEDYHCYRDGGPMGNAPLSVGTVAGSIGPSWATPKQRKEVMTR